MRKFLFLLFVVLVGFSVDDVQRESVMLDWTSETSSFNDDAGVVAWFINPGLTANAEELPVYTRLYTVYGVGNQFKFIVENTEFELIDKDIPEELLKRLSDDIQVKTTLSKSGNEYRSELQIVPLKYENDQLYRLTSFQVKRIPVAFEKSATRTAQWKSSSVLSSGKWIKISASTKGIYKIPFSTLSSWGFNQPSEVRVFGSGGISLSEDPGEIAYDDLEQCTIWHDINDNEQCLFFYSPGVTEWSWNGSQFTHENNDYSSKAYFFLSETAGEGKMLETLDEINDSPTHSISAFDESAFFEQEKYNLLPLGSGKQWYGDKFGNGSRRTYSFSLTDPITSETAELTVSAAARSYESSKLKVEANEENIGEVSFSRVDTDDSYSIYAKHRYTNFQTVLSGNSLSIRLTFNPSNSNAEAWLDYLELNYRRLLKVGDEPVFFRDAESAGAGNVLEFSINNAGAETKILDVTAINEVNQVPANLSGNKLVAVRPADELHEYVVFNPSGNFNVPEMISEVENQNLHGLSTPQFLIISHPDFMASAEELAVFHREFDGMDVEVVDVNKVYNEFSSGSKNATGIRNFIKMFYDRNEQLKYVLLFGDGSYDNKGVDPESNNFIPTYQSDNSLTATSSFVTDDYFVILDAGENVYSGAIDLGIGRIPASTNYEAQLVVDKVKRYYTPETLGSWRNRISFIGDDEDSGLHMRQAEELSDSVNENYGGFITDKIYFDAFVEESTPSGDRYPGVKAAINERVEDGVLILNYTGHANERFLAHERVLDVSDINSWTNKNKLPIFVTATCEFSRFDGDETSAGEYILLNANGGGIGLFSTTRVVYASANFRLSKSFYNFIFENDSNGEHYRMGDVMRLAKVNIGSSVNKRNFSLLADPALKLSYPKYQIRTTSINQEDANAESETIGALQKVTIIGYVSDAFGDKIDDFNGELIPTVYDKQVTMRTLGNGGQTPVNFKVRENIIYKGKSSVSNGDFSFSFVVPKDISYSLGEGKIVYYADNGTEDATGAFTNFEIGGSGSEITDNDGPDIELFLDSHDFQSGDETGKSPLLLANLSDENGINTVGTGVGHDIIAVIDDDYSNTIVLNNYYQANADDYTSGSIAFPLSNLSVGLHTLKLKAWDVANNSSEVEVEFMVTGDFIISGVSAYPNPASDYTYFVLEHNQAGASLDVIIDIYDINGRSIDRFQTTVGSSGSTTNPIRWDLAELKIPATPGIYIYRAMVQNREGLIASKSGKITIAR
ncbi:type IX secretion system sortase PorU [Maribellus mangrovi]|uniref:type IX secretion system sortase PorU n=1 Tax=Maribellus mangrovi TaxID=3133146 RepID=UPI0030EE0AA9